MSISATPQSPFQMSVSHEIHFPVHVAKFALSHIYSISNKILENNEFRSLCPDVVGLSKQNESNKTIGSDLWSDILTHRTFSVSVNIRSQVWTF